MATVQKKEKGLNKYSFRGLTPDQLNELTQEQVVELFRARMRRRFSRSISHPIQKSSTSTWDCTKNARNPKRILSLDKNPSPSRLISEMLLSFPRWLETTSLYTMEKASTMLKSSLIWSVATSENFRSPTSPPATVKLVSEPPRDQLTHLLNDCTYFDGSFSTFIIYGLKTLYELILYL